MSYLEAFHGEAKMGREKNMVQGRQAGDRKQEKNVFFCEWRSVFFGLLFHRRLASFTRLVALFLPSEVDCKWGQTLIFDYIFSGKLCCEGISCRTELSY